MKILKILIYIFLSLEIGISGWVIYREIRDTRRFLSAERRFYFNLREGEEFLRRNIQAYEGCTPAQADSVFDYLCREGWIGFTDELCYDAARHLDSMERCCPRRFIPRLTACIREHDKFSGLIWWSYTSACYRATPRGFALRVLPRCEEVRLQAGGR